MSRTLLFPQGIKGLVFEQHLDDGRIMKCIGCVDVKSGQKIYFDEALKPTGYTILFNPKEYVCRCNFSALANSEMFLTWGTTDGRTFGPYKACFSADSQSVNNSNSDFSVIINVSSTQRITGMHVAVSEDYISFTNFTTAAWSRSEEELRNSFSLYHVIMVVAILATIFIGASFVSSSASNSNSNNKDKTKQKVS